MEKGKLIAGIILIIIGAGLIPASVGMENLLNQRMDESIPSSLSLIGESMQTINRELAYAESTPEVLLHLKDVAIPDIPELVNGSISSSEISFVINNLTSYVGSANATDWFFNDPAWTVNTDGNYSIQGISEYNGLGNLSFTPLAISRTFNKFVEGQVWGLGITDYLSDYEEALTDIPARNAMTAYYNCTWEQINNVTSYLIDHLFPLVQSLGSFPFAATDSTAEDFFLMQWVNTTLVSGSWDLEIAPELEIEGWEYRKYDLNLSQTQALWDTANTSAPLNENGIFLWWQSQTNNTIEEQLKATFNLSNSNYDNLIAYFFLPKFRTDVVGPIYLELNGRTINNLADEFLLLQWANSEFFPDGISIFNPLYENFELTSPPENSGLDIDTIRELWDPNTLLSLRNKTGIRVWLQVAAESDPTEAAEYSSLANEFGLNDTQMEEILDWVDGFRPYAITIVSDHLNLDYHPTTMIKFAKTGSLIAAGVIGFIGLVLVISSFKKQFSFS